MTSRPAARDDPVTAMPQAAIAHDAYWRVKEVGNPPPFGWLPLKLQQCWMAAVQAVAAAARERCAQLAETEALQRGSIAAEKALRSFAALLREQP